MKKFLCVVLVISFLMLSACSVTTQDKVKLFDEVCSLIDESDNCNELTIDEMWEHKEEIHKEISKNLEKLGLDVYYDEEDIEKGFVTIGEEFIDEYLLEHTSSELFENFMKIYSYISRESNYEKYGSWYGLEDGDSHHLLDECLCQRYSNLLELILKRVDYETISFDVNMKGQDGYYTQHPEAEPQSFENEVEGSFNDSSNGNAIYSDTRKNVGTVEYYGDFAILSASGWSYNQGYYGWRNGEFIDIPASWQWFSYCDLYYKGKRIIWQADSLSDIVNSNIEFLDINGKLYQKQLMSVEDDTFEKNIHKFLWLEQYVPSE